MSLTLVPSDPTPISVQHRFTAVLWGNGCHFARCACGTVWMVTRQMEGGAWTFGPLACRRETAERDLAVGVIDRAEYYRQIGIAEKQTRMALADLRIELEQTPFDAFVEALAHE